MRILWVENHAEFVRIAGRQFLASHEFVVAPSISAARKALESATFDAVLVDFDLDDGKGSEVVKLIATLSVKPVVIAVSSHAEGNAELTNAGADAICSKLEFSGIERIIKLAMRSGRPHLDNLA